MLRRYLGRKSDCISLGTWIFKASHSRLWLINHTLSRDKICLWVIILITIEMNRLSKFYHRRKLIISIVLWYVRITSMKWTWIILYLIIAFLFLIMSSLEISLHLIIASLNLILANIFILIFIILITIFKISIFVRVCRKWSHHIHLIKFI